MAGAYLEANPSEKRADDELAQLELVNDVKPGQPLKVKNSSAAYDDVDSGGSYSGDGYSDDEPEFCPACPGHISFSGPVHGLQCGPDAQHLHCGGCFGLMPANVPAVVNGIATSCDMCNARYCAGLWHCPADFAAPKSIEARVDTAISRGGAVLPGLPGLNVLATRIRVLDNSYETSILEAYLTSKGLTPDQMMKECLQKIDSGAIPPVHVAVRVMGAPFSAVAAPPRVMQVTGRNQLCLTCHHLVQNHLSYEYRKSIPNSDLPAEVTRMDYIHTILYCGVCTVINNFC